MMGEHGATMGTDRDLRARVMLALISARPAKPSAAGAVADLVEEARTIMAFITGQAEAAGGGDALPDGEAPEA